MLSNLSNLYQVADIRDMENKAFQILPAFQLMLKAGDALFQQVQRQSPKTIIIFSGIGNNGGDGLVLAKLTQLKGIHTRVFIVGDEKKASSLFKKAKKDALDTMVTILPFSDFNPILHDAELIIDALLGIGLKGKPQGEYVKAIQAINALQGYKIAVDIPTGLNADTGETFHNDVVTVDETITFIGYKLGLFCAHAYDVSGKITLDNLSLPLDILQAATPAALLFKPQSAHLPKIETKNNTHKGNFGHVLIIGGQKGMGGAVILAALSALRAGAGLVSVITHDVNVTACLTSCPEVMVYGLSAPKIEKDFILEKMAKADVLLCGPGMTIENVWSESLLQIIFSAPLPLKTVFDAGALSYIAKIKVLLPASNILTPHPGEAATLLAETTLSVQKDRLNSIKNLYKNTGASIVLKGAGPLLISKRLAHPILLSLANPALSTAGSGDVFAGLLCGLYARFKKPALETMMLACALQAVALECVLEKQSLETFIASDLIAGFAPFFKTELSENRE